MSTEKRMARKEKTIINMYNEVGNHKQIIVISLINIDANQVNMIRKYLRRAKLGLIIIGKNTVIRKALEMRINGMTEKDKESFPMLKESKIPELKPLVELLEGKVAFIFTDANMGEFKKAITRTPVPREARVGALAPCDVVIKEGPTGLPPSEVNFFHALGIQVKINKGILDMQKTTNLIKKGDRVGNSEASLLKKLNLKPFTYPLEFLSVYESGKVYPASVFEVTPEEMIERIQTNVRSFAALSIEASHVNHLSGPLMVANAFKCMLAIGAETGYKMDALTAAASSAKVAAPKAAPKKEEKKVEKKEEPKEEEDVGMGGLFDF